MKRPQGYDRQVPGPAEPAPAKATTPRTSTPKSGVPKSVVPKTGVPKTGVPKTGVPKSDVSKSGMPKTGVSNTRATKSGAGKRGAGTWTDQTSTDQTSTEPITLPAPAAAIAPVSPLRAPSSAPATPPPPVPLTPAGARRKLRAARRARKLYEREEVRRFTWRSRRRRNVWLGSLGALAALIAFVLLGTFSPLMALRTIEVVGANRVPAEQIQSALEGQLGTPLPLVDFAEVKQELSAFTLIQSYVTESRPPNTLVVRIVEREPIGALVTESGFDLVDAAGVVIQSSAERPAGYATIDARAGAGSAGFRAATAVIAALPADIRSSLDTVTAATTDDVTLTLAGGARVVWGSAERSDFKAVVLAALIVTNPVGSVGEYDVSSPDSAVLR